MKINILKIALFTGAFALNPTFTWAQNELSTTSISEGTVGAQVSTGEEEGYTNLATLSVAPGHDITISFNAKDDTVVVDEAGKVDKSTGLPILTGEQFDGLDALELYLALTSSDSAVPAALLTTSTSDEAIKLANARPLTESAVSTVALLIRPTIVKVKQDTGSMTSLCGSNGKAQFESICATGLPGTNQQFCGSGKHTWHQRTSNGKFKQSLSFVVACNASVRSKHGRKAGLWYYKTRHHDVSGVWHYMRVYNKYPSLKLKRRVRAERYNPTSLNSSVSFIRSWIGFKN